MRTTRRVTVANRLGLHARPAAELVKLASGFRAEVKISKDGLEVNGKSILGVMTLAAEQGSELVLSAHGDDAEAALESLETFLSREFETS